MSSRSGEPEYRRHVFDPSTALVESLIVAAPGQDGSEPKADGKKKEQDRRKPLSAAPRPNQHGSANDSAELMRVTHKKRHDHEWRAKQAGENVQGHRAQQQVSRAKECPRLRREMGVIHLGRGLASWRFSSVAMGKE